MTSPSFETLLRNGIAAYRAGDRDRATACFREALTINPRNDYAWIWMSAVMDSDDARRFCLERALALNPHNEAARRYLDKMASRAAATGSVTNTPRNEYPPDDRSPSQHNAKVDATAWNTQTVEPTTRIGQPDHSLPTSTTHKPDIAPAAPSATLPIQLSPGNTDSETEWYYIHQNQRVGPVQEHVIQHLLSTGVISQKSLVWTKGMNRWSPLKSTPLSRLIPSRTGDADRRPWYLSPSCLILSFLFLTPLWVVLILMDWKRQRVGVKVLALIIGFIQIVWFGLIFSTVSSSENERIINNSELYERTAVISAGYSPETASQTPKPTAIPTSTPKPTATPTLIPTPEFRSVTQKIGPIYDSIHESQYSVEITLKGIHWLNKDQHREPRTGNVYVVVDLEIKNLGPGALRSIGLSDFQVKDAKGAIRDYTMLPSFYETCQIETVDLIANGSTEGCISFEVPETGSIELIYAPFQYEGLQPGRYLSFVLREN